MPKSDGWKNLIVPDSETARINGRKGAYAKARKDRERKQLAEVLDVLLKMPLKDGKESSLYDAKSLSKDRVLNANPPAIEMLGLAMLKKALKGDMKAAKMILEVLGEGVQTKTVSPLNELADKLDEYKDTENEEEEE